MMSAAMKETNVPAVIVPSVMRRPPMPMTSATPTALTTCMKGESQLVWVMSLRPSFCRNFALSLYFAVTKSLSPNDFTAL